MKKIKEVFQNIKRNITLVGRKNKKTYYKNMNVAWMESLF